MKTFFLASLLALLAIGGDAAKSVGCGKAAGISSGTYSVTVNGKQRQYVVRVPQNYNPNNAYRLVIALHWYGGSMNDAASINGGYYGLMPLAKESTIFVSPNGLNKGWKNEGGEDIKFIDAITDKMDQALCVDSEQRYAAGWSYGGGMSYAISCARADKFRAVAILSGGAISGCDGGTKPIAAWLTHGIADDVAPFTSGQAARDHYLKINGCQNKDAPTPPKYSGTHIKTEYQCMAGYPVTWIAHSGPHTATPSDGNQPSWAPGEMWKFFTQFSSSNPTSQPTPQPTPSTSTSSPQPTSTTTKPPSGGAALYGQCGGNGWTGPTTCAQGRCVKVNDYYSQCQN